MTSYRLSSYQNAKHTVGKRTNSTSLYFQGGPVALLIEEGPFLRQCVSCALRDVPQIRWRPLIRKIRYAENVAHSLHCRPLVWRTLRIALSIYQIFFFAITKLDESSQSILVRSFQVVLSDAAADYAALLLAWLHVILVALVSGFAGRIPRKRFYYPPRRTSLLVMAEPSLNEDAFKRRYFFLACNTREGRSFLRAIALQDLLPHSRVFFKPMELEKKITQWPRADELNRYLLVTSGNFLILHLLEACSNMWAGR
ncbi:hypothetical protein EDD18DRAFT_493655 [Armillaria luteobubalina]|uniref:Uncharacterized protein n=1 Tax=Armillaria luteobubalina TaxID=153913 RepID=A0AA39V3M8_9AGAR|nr:hypothetical protein EDD18DRAFT_493655 [Armillaria luteobubalina]